MKKKIEKEDIEELKSIWMDPKIFKELKEQKICPKNYMS